MKRSAAIIALSLFAVIFGAPAFASTIYFQTEGLPPFGGGGVYSEADGPTKVYDNFTLAGASVITHLAWVGVSTVNIGAGTPGDYFEADFYQDQGGAPGSLVSSNTFHISGIPYAGLPNYYTYDAPVNVSITGGSPYWLSIFTYGTSSQWAWDKGFGGDGHSLVYNNPPGSGSYTYAHDEAFTLTYGAGPGGPPPPPPPPGPSAFIPEPSGLLLSATGLLSLTGVIRRRLKG